MPRRSMKKFDFASGIYYFNINTSQNSSITIKRMELKKAVEAYSSYLKNYKGKCQWLGKWDGSKFVDDNFEKMSEKVA